MDGMDMMDQHGRKSRWSGEGWNFSNTDARDGVPPMRILQVGG